MDHKHLIIRGEITRPPRADDVEIVNDWVKRLVAALNMNILLGPYTVYCPVEGNRGMTSICAIETSSITVHIWDEGEAPIIQLDVYSCSPVDIDVVLELLKDFGDMYNLRFMLIDRDYSISDNVPRTLKILDSYV